MTKPSAEFGASGRQQIRADHEMTLPLEGESNLDLSMRYAAIGFTNSHQL
jgi:hypothetical protein